MADMSLKKNPMPEQDPIVRAKNFDEVALGYTEEQAVAEANRCLNCKNPLCRTGCPVSVRIPEFIAKVVERDFDAAYDILTSTNSNASWLTITMPKRTRPLLPFRPLTDIVWR